MFETRREIQIGVPDPTVIVRTRVSGLSAEYATRLLDRELRRVGLGADAVALQDKREIVDLLGGHPIAISLAANAIYENGLRQVLKDIRERKGFYDRYVGRLINSLNVTPEERSVLRLLNGCRIPVPREAILAACEFPAGPVITRLVSLCVIDVSRMGHIHVVGIVKPYFEFTDLPDDVQLQLHKNAAREFGALAQAFATNLEYAVEADYHAAMVGEQARYAERLLDSRLAAAQALYDGQNFEKARQIVDSLLKAKRSGRVLRLSALVDAQCGSLDTALQKVRESFAKQSADPWILSEIAKIALSLQRYDMAEGIILTAKSAGIDDVSIALIEGRWALRRRDIAEAERIFSHAIEITIYNAWPYFYLGRTLLHEGRVGDAIDVLLEGEDFISRKQVRGRTVLRGIRTLLARAYLYDDDLDAAERVVMGLFEENPDDPEIVRVYAAYTLKREGVSDAQKAFEKLASAKVRNRYDDCQKHLFLGLFYLGINQRSKAAKEFSEAHRADRNNVFVLIKWARTLLDMAKSALQEENEPDIAQGYARDCGRMVNRILHFSPQNPSGLRLQEDLYSVFAIDTRDLRG